MMAKKSGGVKIFLGTVLLSAIIALQNPAPVKADQVIYSEGFETDDGGYTSDAGAGLEPGWEWGTPSTTGPAAANTGTKCWGTDLDAEAPATQAGGLYSPSIDLPVLTAAQVARVSFYGYIDINMTGRGQFLVSLDRENWDVLADLYMNMLPGWNRYEFDVSAYAGASLFLQFKAVTSTGGSPGFYIDDVALTIYDSGGGDTQIIDLEANEDNANASCPWVFPWNGFEFVRDNDIYSVARHSEGEYRDYYLLARPLVAREGVYPLEIREVEQENSWTDMVGLIAVDHAEGVMIGPDGQGNIHAYRPAELLAPVTARGNGADVGAAVSSWNDHGVHGYGDDDIDLDFGEIDTSAGARLVLRVKGFNSGQGEYRPFIGPPAVVVQVPAADGSWREAGRLQPRFEWSTNVFDLTAAFSRADGATKVRLHVISHGDKYHEVDIAALAIGPEPAMAVHHLDLSAATFAGRDVSAILRVADNDYQRMAPGEKIRVDFTAPPPTGAQRDFVLVSEGYYIPTGHTFFVYTWDGAAWVLRDGYSFPYPGDELKSFDLSLFLPDPDGEYKVRLWQDFMSGYGNASIDYIGFRSGAGQGILEAALDLRYLPDQEPNVAATYPDNLMGWVEKSDNVRYHIHSWDTGGRNRWSEFQWITGESNMPPVTSPVVIQGDTIFWTYNDADADPQANFEVEIWTGPGGSGENKWDPPVSGGGTTALDYNGPPLADGTYYVRVKASDGTNWGGWSETLWFVASARPAGETSAAYRLFSVPLLDVPGNSLAEAIAGGMPEGLTCGRQGDLRIFRILPNSGSPDHPTYEEMQEGDPPFFATATVNAAAAGTTTDLSGLAFWRIVGEEQRFRYTGAAVGAADVAIKLAPGWNAFGFPFNEIERIDIADLWVSDGNGVEYPLADPGNPLTGATVWEYEDRDGDGAVDDQADDGSPYDPARYIARNYGYWLYVDSPAGVVLHVPRQPRTDIADAAGGGRGPLGGAMERAALAVPEKTPPAPPAAFPNAGVSGGGGAAGGGCFIGSAGTGWFGR